MFELLFYYQERQLLFFCSIINSHENETKLLSSCVSCVSCGEGKGSRFIGSRIESEYGEHVAGEEIGSMDGSGSHTLKNYRFKSCIDLIENYPIKKFFLNSISIVNLEVH